MESWITMANADYIPSSTECLLLRRLCLIFARFFGGVSPASRRSCESGSWFALDALLVEELEVDWSEPGRLCGL
jgi:hypothetical protein